MTTAPILSLHNIVFGYEKDRTVLHGLSFDVQPGTITAILGPNGAGKTTLLHLILGLMQPAGGSIVLGGRSLSDYSRRELSRWVGLVPQREHAAFDYSVLEYILMGRAPYLGILEQPSEADYQAAIEALRTLDLLALQERPVTALSGGELQLVLVARALAQQPKVLLLDEPTSHLDLGNKYRILNIIRDLARSGVTVLFTTHDPEAASAVAGWVALMRDGQVLDFGELDEIFTAEKLSRAYNLPLQVMRVNGRNVLLEGERSGEHLAG